MGCGCGKSGKGNKNFPPKKSSRMPMKKPGLKQESQMTYNDRRAKIIKIQNARKLKQIRKQQFEWERRTNNENL